MTWEEFVKQKHQTINNEWEITDVECPDCGQKIFKNTMIVLTTYPAQTAYLCPHCGWRGTA